MLLRRAGRGLAIFGLGAMLVPSSSCGSHVLGASTIPGDHCSEPGRLACGTSADGATAGIVLSCVAAQGSASGTWAMVFQCPAVQACSSETGDTSITCGPPGDPTDDAFAIEGASCAVDGNAACTFDRSGLLNCVAGTWTQVQACGAGPSGACQSIGPGTTLPGGSCPPEDATGCVVCGE